MLLHHDHKPRQLFELEILYLPRGMHLNSRMIQRKKTEILEKNHHGNSSSSKLVCFSGEALNDNVALLKLNESFSMQHSESDSEATQTVMLWRTHRRHIGYAMLMTYLLMKTCLFLYFFLCLFSHVCNNDLGCYVYTFPFFCLICIVVCGQNALFYLKCSWVSRIIYFVENNCVFCVFIHPEPTSTQTNDEGGDHHDTTHSSTPSLSFCKEKDNQECKKPSTMITMYPFAESKRYVLSRKFPITLIHYQNTPLMIAQIAFFHLPQDKTLHQPLGCDVVNHLKLSMPSKGRLSKHHWHHVEILVAFCYTPYTSKETTSEFSLFLEKSGFTILFQEGSAVASFLVMAVKKNPPPCPRSLAAFPSPTPPQLELYSDLDQWSFIANLQNHENSIDESSTVKASDGLMTISITSC